jgi:hypothetical protein
LEKQDIVSSIYISIQKQASNTCIQLDYPSSLPALSTVLQATGNYANHGFCSSLDSKQKESTTGHAMLALNRKFKIACDG